MASPIHHQHTLSPLIYHHGLVSVLCPPPRYQHTTQLLQSTREWRAAALPHCGAAATASAADSAAASAAAAAARSRSRSRGSGRGGSGATRVRVAGLAGMIGQLVDFGPGRFDPSSVRRFARDKPAAQLRIQQERQQQVGRPVSWSARLSVCAAIACARCGYDPLSNAFLSNCHAPVCRLR
jgi:hypothetical protein